jgi:hypothetical protein
MPMPHHCLTNLEQTKANMTQYFIQMKYNYLKQLKGSNQLTWYTICMAVNFATTKQVSSSSGLCLHCPPLLLGLQQLTSYQDAMVARALELWSASRMIEVSWKICGEDTLGLAKIDDETNPWNGTIPITPIMDTQLDQIVIQCILLPLQRILLVEFQNRIKTYRPEMWLEMFLTVFVLLCSIESNVQHQNRFATRYGMGVSQLFQS